MRSRGPDVALITVCETMNRVARSLLLEFFPEPDPFGRDWSTAEALTNFANWTLQWVIDVEARRNSDRAQEGHAEGGGTIGA